jgi:membrane-associated phospholipid phosphatase
VPDTTQSLPAWQVSLCPMIFSDEEAYSVTMLVTWLARAGWILEQPLFWGTVATALAGKGGARGRQAALRGSVCYLVAAFIANIGIKPLANRRRPQSAGEGRIAPVTSSFPSGHTASNSAFVFGVAQELPLLAVALAAAATTAHWSLIRSEKHHVSDVLAGGAIGLGVARIMRKSRPPDTPRESNPNDQLGRVCPLRRQGPRTAVRPEVACY